MTTTTRMTMMTMMTTIMTMIKDFEPALKMAGRVRIISTPVLGKHLRILYTQPKT